MPAAPTSTTSGVLRPEQLGQHIDLQRAPCSAEIATWVEGYWQLRWSMPPGQTYLSQILPHPAVSLTVERGDTRDDVHGETVVVSGVPTHRFEVNVKGHGTVFGIKFRPGGFTAMFGTAANTLRDLVVPAVGLVPQPVHETLIGLESELKLSDWTARIDRLLIAPEPDAEYSMLLDIIARMLTDRTLLRVSQVEQQVGIGRRSLQRLFSHYVGVSPKWVLSRYRMHDVVTAIDDGYDGLLTDLAVTYGWYDQSHFIRDFSALIGTTPSVYQGEARRQSRRP